MAPEPLFTLYAYLKYFIKAKGAHGLHSPFLFELYNQVIVPSKRKPNAQIESLRNELLANKNTIRHVDFKSGRVAQRPISHLAANSLSTPRFSSFLVRLCEFLSCSSVLETGTNLGINALYLSTAATVKKVSTLEGNPELTTLARQLAHQVGSTNITFTTGLLADTFEKLVHEAKPELVFLDADHRSAALDTCIQTLIPHFPSIQAIVIHDIYWSRDMHVYWNSLVNDPRIPLTVDIFQAGILFPQVNMEKQHFTIKF
ncbi:MAG: class I SAM-dependent methyltransferase [Cyclobacteriaceae bacterium]|nr:class I SAM-dependent methyltransferase [Cyclobacteriaceae bacterium]